MWIFKCTGVPNPCVVQASSALLSSLSVPTCENHYHEINTFLLLLSLQLARQSCPREKELCFGGLWSCALGHIFEASVCSVHSMAMVWPVSGSPVTSASDCAPHPLSASLKGKGITCFFEYPLPITGNIFVAHILSQIMKA